MEIKEKDEIGLRTKSFREEDYNNRRVFLRSYPLRWGGEDEGKDEEIKVVSTESNSNRKKKLIKKMIVSVIHWSGGKVLVLRRFKHKFTIHVIACIALSFKRPTALICAR